MNAPARFPVVTEPSRAERAYRATISTHCPNQDEAALAYRVALAALRDQASVGLAKCCPEAAPLLLAVASQATVAVYAPLSTAKLFLLRAALTLTMEAARSIERAYADGR